MKIMIVTKQLTSEFVYDDTNMLIPEIKKCQGNNNCWGCIKPEYKKPCGLAINAQISKKNKNTLFLETMDKVFNFLKEKEVDYYWTHFIKCPGNNKSSTFSNACADKWIKKEVEYFKPDRIISFGGDSGCYFLGKSITLKEVVGRFDLTYKCDNKNIPLLILPLPSIRNKEWNKKNGNYNKSLDTIKKFVLQ